MDSCQEKHDVMFGYPDFWPKVHESFPTFFEGVFSLNDLANQTIKAAEQKAREPAEKVIWMLVRITTIGMYELLTLAGNGAGPGAMKISRGMFESSTIAEYIRRNPPEAKDYLEFRHILNWIRHQWLLKSFPETARKINSKKVQEIEQNYNHIKSRFADRRGKIRNRWHNKSIAQMAQEVGRSEQYDLSYSLGASIHHSNCEGMLAYVEVEDEKVLLDAPPSMEWVPQALISGHTYLLQGLDTLNECLNLGLDSEIRVAGEEFRKAWSNEKPGEE